MKQVNIYIDTNLKNPRRGDGTCQYILSYETKEGKVADTGAKITRKGTTENQLTAAGLLTALSRLNTPCNITLYLENAYIAAVLQNQWIQEWHDHNWKTAKAKPVKDAETWKQIYSLLNIHTIELKQNHPHPYKEWIHRELGMKPPQQERKKTNGKKYPA